MLLGCTPYTPEHVSVKHPETASLLSGFTAGHSWNFRLHLALVSSFFYFLHQLRNAAAHNSFQGVSLSLAIYSCALLSIAGPPPHLSALANQEMKKITRLGKNRGLIPAGCLVPIRLLRRFPRFMNYILTYFCKPSKNKTEIWSGSCTLKGIEIQWAPAVQMTTFVGEAERLTPRKETRSDWGRGGQNAIGEEETLPLKEVSRQPFTTIGWSKSSEDGQRRFRQCLLLFLLWQHCVEQNIAKNTTLRFPSFLSFLCCPDHVLPKACTALCCCLHMSKSFANIWTKY